MIYKKKQPVFKMMLRSYTRLYNKLYIYIYIYICYCIYRDVIVYIYIYIYIYINVIYLLHLRNY